VSTHETTSLAAFANRLPKCLDEIFTSNRDKAKLALATEEQIKAFAKIIPNSDHVTGAISDWRIVAYTVTIPGHEGLVHLHPLGNDDTAGIGCKISSPIVGIDLGTRLVVTHSGSLYRLVGPQGEGEPTFHQLLHLCAAQWQWGRGKLFGVFHVFY
jgi:hypothetical protein